MYKNKLYAREICSYCALSCFQYKYRNNSSRNLRAAVCKFRAHVIALTKNLAV